MTHTASLRRRPALTLVELLVVITLIIVLAGLAVAVSQSGVFGSQKVISGADRVSGWLLIAKQRAMRDGLPRGVRFLLNPVRDPLLNPTNDPYYFVATEAQYIESPEAWVPNPNPGNPNPTGPIDPTGPKGPRIAFVYWHEPTTNILHNNSALRQVHFTTDPSRQQDLFEFDQRVVVGDYLTLPELGRVGRIIGIANSVVNLTVNGNPVPHQSRRLFLANGSYPDLGANNSGALGGPPNSCRVVYEHGFQPAPRPLIGEPTLQLTGGTIIDCRMMVTPPVAPDPFPTATLATTPTSIGVSPIMTSATQGHIDALFSPSGGLMYTPGGIVCLWVRDPEKTPHPRIGPTGVVDDKAAYDAAGEQALVTIYTHTGLIATHPPAWIAPVNNDPYRYAKDGINSGL